MTCNAANRLLFIEGLGYCVNGARILEDIGLEGERGEFIGIIGPNGAGKTTLLKCIGGLYKGVGRIEIEGADIRRLNGRQMAAKVAMLHQDTTVTFPFSAIDVVMMGRYRILGKFKPESAVDYAVARKCMKLTGTLELENRRINTLSGGERQKVLLAKVLAQETEIVLLDEPSSNLDIASEEQVFSYASELCRDGKLVIAAVHDLKTAVRFCTRLILMKKGRIIADGPPAEVITGDNLKTAYGVNALVYKNRITGLVDFHIAKCANDGRGATIHVIGGGGSASGVFRHLFENGYNMTAGVFAQGDSDLGCAAIFGIKTVACKPFSDIDDNALAENIALVKAADVTVLCDMPFGMQNIRNLEAAAHARKLVIIEDGNPEGRDFTGGRAMAMYSTLKERAAVIESARLHEILP